MSAKRKKAPQVRGAEKKPPPGRRFVKGKSGNPGGQPLWVKAIRDSLEGVATGGAELLRKVVDGEKLRLSKAGQTVEVTPELHNRLKAIELAFAYTLPKPTTKIEVETLVRVSLATELDAFFEDLKHAIPREHYLRALEVAAARSGGTPAGGGGAATPEGALARGVGDAHSGAGGEGVRAAAAPRPAAGGAGEDSAR